MLKTYLSAFSPLALAADLIIVSKNMRGLSIQPAGFLGQNEKKRRETKVHLGPLERGEVGTLRHLFNNHLTSTSQSIVSNYPMMHSDDMDKYMVMNITSFGD